MLEVDHLNAGYGGKNILTDTSFHIDDREIAVIIGHNGAGKTTILKSIFSLIPWKKGEIRFNGQSIMKFKSHEILSKGLAYIPQNHSVFPKLTVYENMWMGGYIISDKQYLKDKIEAVLPMFPVLTKRLKQMAGNLSGGEQRMLEIARTLLLDPALIMLDEPSLGLAPKMVDHIFEIILQLRETGKSILMVEQNVKKGLSVSDRGYVLELGMIKLEDKAQNLIDDERVARLYMGR
jgi:branched-chain amino acid transport system ATP-binding protein